jgi:hypothetical protein
MIWRGLRALFAWPERRGGRYPRLAQGSVPSGVGGIIAALEPPGPELSQPTSLHLA